jgi:hypothetical protein
VKNERREGVTVSGEQRAIKKRGRVLLTFLFSTLSFLICSCEIPNAGGSGQGYFSLSIDGAGRTIMPQTGKDGFKVFTLEFFEGGTEKSKSVLGPLILEGDDLEKPIPLNAGTYDLLATAYMDKDGNMPAALAREPLAGILITPQV